MRGLISWNGTRSDQFGIGIEKYPNYARPQRKFDKYTIPGRNGDLIVMQDAWENVEQSYEIIAGDGEQSSAPGYFASIADWLCAPKGYCELWDDFDPGYYRLAYFSGKLNVSALSDGRYGRATITFVCKPQRYLVSGRETIDISSTPGSVFNFTSYNAKPLLFVTRSGSGNGTVTIGDTIFTITGIPAGGLYIDCEELNCYDTNGTNMNSHVASSTSEFAVLEPGENSIGFTGKVRKVAVTPRWFEI